MEVPAKPRSYLKLILALAVVLVIVVAGVGYYEVYVVKPAPVTLVVYGSVDTTAMQPLIKEFQGNYSWITVQYTEYTPPNAYSAITAAKAGNKSTADVVFLTNSIMNLLQAKGYLATYSSPEVSSYPSSYYDAGGHWAAALVLPVVFSYNTHAFASADLPSLTGVANKSLAGQEIILDPTLGSTGTQYLLSLEPVLGNQTWTAWLHQLATNVSPSPTSATNTVVDDVASGQYEIGVFSYLKDVVNLQLGGANIGWFLPKMANGTSIPMMTALESLGILQGTPHLQAAEDFENFVLSKGGQETEGNTPVLIPAMPGISAKYTLSNLAPGANVVLFPTPQVSAEAAAWGATFKQWGF